MTAPTGNPTFHEKQKIRHVWWIILIIYGAAALMWYSFIQQIIIGEPYDR